MLTLGLHTRSSNSNRQRVMDMLADDRSMPSARTTEPGSEPLLNVRRCAAEPDAVWHRAYLWGTRAMCSRLVARNRDTVRTGSPKKGGLEKASRRLAMRQARNCI